MSKGTHAGVGKSGAHQAGSEMHGPSRTSGKGEKFANNIIGQPFMPMTGQDAGAGSVRSSTEKSGNARHSSSGASRPYDGIKK